MTTTTTPISSSSTTTTGRSRRFVDPYDLTCPGCGERPVRCVPPGYWRVADGLPAPQFSHQDRSPLCGDTRGTVAEPIEDKVCNEVRRREPA